MNTAHTDLRIQIVQYVHVWAPTVGTYFCYAIAGMTSLLVLSASDFTTTCWDSANRGTPWDGTNATGFEFIIPSQSQSPTPFDVCIQNVVFQ